jgi:hypothetical protein
MVFLIDSIRDAVRSVDTLALVGIGYFAPDTPNSWRPGDPRLVVAWPAVNASKADYVGIHPYPFPDGLTLSEFVENFGFPGFRDKPVMMEEFGAFKSGYSERGGADAMRDWQVESCSFDVKGWLGWTWDTNRNEQPEIWAANLNNRHISDALSPRLRPDPCLPRVFKNVALDADVTASQSLPDQQPGMAVDGSKSTPWGAGDFAPQWIEVDLGAPHDVSKIRLTVSQFPEGQTLHRVFGRTQGGALVTLRTFNRVTEEGDVLEVLPTAPFGSIRAVRVETESSPSWVAWHEIEVFGEPTPP